MKKTLSFEEFVVLGKEVADCELVHGISLPIPADPLEAEVRERFSAHLQAHLERNFVGFALDREVLYRFAGRSGMVSGRRPSVSVILHDQLRAAEVPRVFFNVTPPLCLEVVAGAERAVHLERRLQEYLAAGVPLVWVIYPLLRIGRVATQDSPFHSISEDGHFDGGDVLPGLKIRVGDCLPPADMVPPPEPEDE